MEGISWRGTVMFASVAPHRRGAVLHPPAFGTGRRQPPTSNRHNRNQPLTQPPPQPSMPW